MVASGQRIAEGQLMYRIYPRTAHSATSVSGKVSDSGSVLNGYRRFTDVVVQPGEVLYIFRVKVWKIREIKLKEVQESHLTRTWDFLSIAVVFNFSVALFLLLPVDLISSQAHILTSFVFMWYPVTEKSSIFRVHHFRILFTSRWNQVRLLKRHGF